jgi:hypothetical protein
MHDDVLSLAQASIRGADSNSLLRMYDAAQGIFQKSLSQQERTREDRTMQRIARELQKRNIPR